MTSLKLKAIGLMLLGFLFSSSIGYALSGTSTSVTVNGTANSTDAGASLVMDSGRFVYVAGKITNDVVGTDIWIAKYDPALNLINSVTITGGEATNIFLDSDTTLYITGALTVGSTARVWVGKFDTNLNVITSTAIPGPIVASGNAIIANANGIYVTGRHYTGSVTFTWVGKFDSNLVLLSSTSIDANVGSAYGSDLTSDSSGNIYIAGFSNPSARIAKLDSNLVFQSSITAPIAGTSDARTITFINNSLYVGGYIDDATENTNGWLGIYDTSLSLLQTQIFSNNGYDGIEDFHYDSTADRLFFTGYYNVPGQDRNFWVGECLTSLVLVSTQTINGSSSSVDSGAALWSDDTGRVFATGYLNNTSTGNDIFVIRYFTATDETGVNRVRVYPNPFRPKLGHVLITIDQLPQNAALTLYTLSGDRIIELHTDAEGSARWNGKNESGENVGSGIYFGMVEKNGSHKTFKLAIER